MLWEIQADLKTMEKHDKEQKHAVFYHEHHTSFGPKLFSNIWWKSWNGSNFQIYFSVFIETRDSDSIIRK